MEDTIHLVILGAGGHATELKEYLGSIRKTGVDVRLLGFVDEHKPQGDWQGSRIIGGFRDLADLVRASSGPIHYITAVGSNPLRQRFVDVLGDLPESDRPRPWTLQHPTAIVGENCLIGVGTCLAPGALVTAQATIGRHCILNVKASVSHDCEVGDYVNINPGATLCGNVRVGAGSFVGAGATVIEKVAIGERVTIGAGAVVLRDLPSGVTAVGVPARVITTQSLG